MKLTLAGKIISAHGIKGAVKVFSYLEMPENFQNFKNLYDKTGNKIIFKYLSSYKNQAVLLINNNKNRNQAEELKNLELYINREDLPNLSENYFYYEDLKNLKVLDKNKSEIGIVTNVISNGSNDIIEIKFNNNEIELFAFTKITFPEIDVEKGFLTLNPPEIDIDK